jgi:hypothetical protein
MPTFAEKMQYLDEVDRAAMDLAKAIMKADSGELYSLDLLALAALNRSRSNIHGFKNLIGLGNYFAAIPFVRLQLDSVLRLFSTTLVDNPDELAQKILKGESISKIKDRSGTKMRDAYLLGEFAKLEPWVTTVYDSGSGFIHLSNKHIIGLFSGSGEDGVFQIAIGPTQDNIPEELRVEAVAAVTHITQLILTLCRRWLHKKTAT